MLEWLKSAGSLAWGIGRHFYLWVLPLLLLQPIDILDKLGVHLEIPDVAVYALVAAGLFVSAVDAFHQVRLRASDLEESESARLIVGLLAVSPWVAADLSGLTVATLQPCLRFTNASDRPLIYRVDAMGAVLGRDASPPQGNPQPMTLAPHTSMDYRGTTVPNPGDSASLDLKVNCEYRYGMPLSRSVVKMVQTFEAVVDVGANGAVVISPYTVSNEPATFETVDDKHGLWSAARPGPLLKTEMPQ